MSLNWKWSEKMGTCEYDNGFIGTLYQGNALVIALAETEKTYTLTWFATDEAHMKNMLGLTKGYEECFSQFGIKKISLDTKYRNTAKIVQLLAKAKIPITIELY